MGREIATGRFAWSLDAEDVHLNIEKRLTALVGEAGKRLHTARSRNDQVATDLADYLVRKGVAFRDAHEIVARAVREAERTGVDLARMPLSKLQKFSSKIGRDVTRFLTLEGSVAARNHIGGTAPAQVRAAVARARKRLAR